MQRHSHSTTLATSLNRQTSDQKVRRRGRGFTRSKGLIAALFLTATLGMVGIAAATSSPPTTVYSACLNVKQGTMSSVSRTTSPKCGAGAVNITWNAVGPKGDPGARGPQGLKGESGPRGKTGPAGPAGADGVGIEASLAWTSGTNYTGSTSAMHHQERGGAPSSYETTDFSKFTFLKSTALPAYAANLTATVKVSGGFCNYVCSFNLYSVRFDGSVYFHGGFAMSNAFLSSGSMTAQYFSPGDVLVMSGVQLLGNGSTSRIAYQPSVTLTWAPATIDINP